ncbi:winged helix-turn-helix transcriptional regulator [Actinophytocola sp.]|uniref:winged helix-turn-helix transcriptional regulator n=1 Tax=Actinophytocola sp. TaxID=1872138 RepID=UPI003899F496
MNHVHTVCVRFHTAIELLGARWSGAILRVMFTGAHRYADIRAAVPGISDVMLTRRLRELEEAGLLRREVLATSPVQVEYHLTQMGEETEPVLNAVIDWSHRWLPLPPGTADDEESHPREPGGTPRRSARA